MQGEMVLVSWYDCDCPWWTKLCDEFHRKSCLIPKSVLREWEGDV